MNQQWLSLPDVFVLKAFRTMRDERALESKEVHSVDEWSTPDRRRGDRDLDCIPNEIYLKIISEVDDDAELRNLALVCRFFASVVLPRLFEEIYIETYSSRLWKSNGYPKLYRALREGSDPHAISVCKYIRTCKMRHFNFGAIKPPRPSSLVSYLEDLQKMPNLTSLSLTNMELSKDILKIISQLSNLASLYLDHCYPSVDITEADIIALADALCLDFLLLLPPSDQRVATFDSLLLSSQLTKLSTNSHEFIRFSAARGVIPSLQFLELGAVHDLMNVYQLSSQVSMLVELRLHNVEWPEGVPDPVTAGSISPEIHFTLPLSAFPNLRQLWCSARLAYLFSGPHHLERISFGSDRSVPSGDLSPTHLLKMTKDACLFFDGPNQNLRKLESLPSGFMKAEIKEKWHGKMQTWFPKLKTLNFIIIVEISEDCQSDTDKNLNSDPVMKIEDYEDYFEELLQFFLHAWGPFNTLTELTFDIIDEGIYDSKDNYKEATARRKWFQDFAPKLNLRDNFPNLTCMSFGNVQYI
ncbi:hypothetical protein GYMLUDRAFT_84303 [Collybiopsis luxurians FD-317 M1]|uniref:F-box domain-containing protein n=1 Tax=Collybiopsis luxurians FD-317 M1 TaxID=944289 RepID=A0A0D0BG74_9AGAR|nr:hypothetical protein GYMLUDRAFT_84303 [Collybiopsis luxurians FD-317 M1]